MATQTRLKQRMDQLTLGDLIRYFEFHNRTDGKSRRLWPGTTSRWACSSAS